MSTPVAATSEQRKIVEMTHGADIAAILSDQQILDIVSKMESSAPVAETPSQSAIAPALSGLSKSGAESVAKSIKSTKSAKSTKSTKSVKSSTEEAAQTMMIDNVPSMKSEKSVKSTKSAIKSVLSAKSAKSAKSKASATPSKMSSVAPTNLDENAPQQDQPKDVLVTAGTYDDGFEINF